MNLKLLLFNVHNLQSIIANTTLYEPGKNAKEEEIRRFLKVRWEEKYGY
jgi:putative ATPase